jgi:hypothetical protein
MRRLTVFNIRIENQALASGRRDGWFPILFPAMGLI